MTVEDCINLLDNNGYIVSASFLRHELDKPTVEKVRAEPPGKRLDRWVAEVLGSAPTNYLDLMWPGEHLLRSNSYWAFFLQNIPSVTGDTPEHAIARGVLIRHLESKK